MRSDGGRRGGDRHDELVNLVRFDLVVLLRMSGWPESMGLPDGLMLHALTNLRDAAGDGRSPDVVLTSGSEELGDLLVEIGDYDVAKWPEWVTVMHVAKDHRVTVINGRRGAFELKASACLQALFELACPACGGLAGAHRLRIDAGHLVDDRGERLFQMRRVV